MAKTLVIKGANFETNKLATVIFGEQIPCTGVTLNKGTATLTSIGATETLVATLAPTDTTDIVSWASSDTNVATVNNGVVTAVGVGSATITVTCGTQTAICTITVAITLNGDRFYPGAYISGTPLSSGGNGILEVTDVSSTMPQYATIGSSEGTLYLHGKFNNERIYPLLLPNNTGRLKITRTNTTVTINAIRCMCSTSSPEGKPAESVLVASIAPSSIQFTDGVAIVNIPVNESLPVVDSVVFNFTKANNTEFLESDFDVYTIEALPPDVVE